MSEDCHNTSACKQHLHHCLARDREASESNSYICFIVHTITRYVETTVRSTRVLCVKHVSHRPSHMFRSEKLFLAISKLWKHIHGKSATVAGRKTDECISLPEAKASAISFCSPSQFSERGLGTKLKFWAL